MIQLEVPIQVSEGLPNGAFWGAYCGPNIRLCSGLKSNSIFPRHQSSAVTTIHIILIKYDSFMDRK